MDNVGSVLSKRKQVASGATRIRPWYVAAALLVAAWGSPASAQDLSVYQDAHGGIYITPGTGNDQPSVFDDLTQEGDSVDTTWTVSPGAEQGAAYGQSLRVTSIPPSWVPSVAATAQHALDIGASVARDFLGDPNKHVNEAFCQLKGASMAQPPPPPFAGSGQAPRSQGPPRAPGATDAAKTNGDTASSDPVNPFNGEFVIQETDLEFPGFGVPFKQTRTYRSRTEFNGPMGYGWDHSLNRRLVADESGSCHGITYSNGDGTSMQFSATATLYTPLPEVGMSRYEIIYASPSGVRSTLHATGTVFTTGGGGGRAIRTAEWRLTTPDGIVEIFDVHGLMTRVEDLNHYGLAVTWEEAATGDNYRVAQVVDSVGRVITYEYDSADRLTKVAHGASGLQATYTYESGDLNKATSSAGKVEYYAYDNGHPDDHEDFIPEGQLRATCDRLCGPAGSSCDASGVCDNIAAQAKQQCLTSCTACNTECDASCDSYCTGILGVGHQECVSTAGAHGEPSCDSQCRQTCETQTEPACRAIYEGRSLVPNVPPPETSVEDLCNQCVGTCSDNCAFSCNNIAVCLGGAGLLGGVATPLTGAAAAIACFGQYGFEDGLNDLKNLIELGIFAGWDSLQCAANTVCGWFGADCFDCDYSSTEDQFAAACNNNCTTCCAHGDSCSSTSCQAGHECRDDCREAFFGRSIGPSDHGDMCQNAHTNGCLQKMYPACLGQCDYQCGEACSNNCDARCDQACATTCGITDGSCARDCEALDYVGACRAGCTDECANQGRHDVPPKYGHLQDLNHNLKTIFNASYVPYLVNTYGQDPAKVNFDAVITQVNAGHSMAFEYRDLKGEGLSLVSPPASGSNAARFATALTGYESVDICPSVCAIPPKNLAERWFPWAGGGLVRMTSASSTGIGTTSDVTTVAPVPPTLLTLGGSKGAYRASSVTGAAGLPAGLAFKVKLDSGGTATFTPTSTGVWKLEGPDEIIAKLLKDSSEIVLGRDSGGTLRVLAGRPSAVAYLSSGSCSVPFTASVTDAGQLAISPEGACSNDLTVFPMATAVRDTGIIGLVSKGDNSTLSQADTFDPTALTSARFSTRWVGLGGGKYSGTLGPADGGALSSLAAAEIRTVNGAPVLALPSPPSLLADGRPLFAFHLPTELRPVLDPKKLFPVWDIGYQFTVPITMRCGDIRTPFREVGARPRNTLPASASVVTDPFGVTWTFYYDGNGRTLRQVNQATHAVRSFNYDEIGDLVGVEEPLGGRMCLRYDVNGNLLESQQFPIPNAVGPTSPIRRRWTYKAFPARPEKVFDPRDPTKVLTTYQWDDRGRLQSITDAANSQTLFLTTEYGLPREIRGPSGSAETIEYDESAGLPSRVVTDANGASPVVRTVTYDAAGRPTDATGPLGEQLAWTWDGGKLLGTQNDADGLTSKTSYEIVDGQVHATTHGMRVVEATYDLMGLPRTTRARALDGSAADRLACTSYGPNARLLEEIRPDGSRVKYSYDGEGRLAEVTAGAWPRASDDGFDTSCIVATPAQGEFTSGSLGATTYDKDGRAIVVRDAAGDETRIVYDGFGRPAIVTDARGTSHRAGYDAMDNVIWTATYAPNTATTWYGPPSYNDAGHGMMAAATATYDLLGRVSSQDVWQFDSAGAPIGSGATAGHSTTTYAYRTAWNQISVTDPVGAETIQTFDGAGRLVLTQFATSDTEAITYLDNGRTVLREWSAPTQDGMLSERTVLTAWGAPARRESNETGSLQLMQSWSYNVDHQPIGSSSASGTSQTYRYDAFGEVVGSERRVGTTSELVTVSYDPMGRVVLSTNDAGNGRGAVRSVLTYDVLGRLRTASYPGSRSEDYRYKLASGLVATSHDSRGVAFNYAYTAGMVDSLTAVPTADVATATQKLTYTRDALGRAITATHSGASFTSTTDDIVTTMAYDSMGTTQLEWNSAAGQTAAVTTVPDAVGRPRRSGYATTTFQRQYDGLGRLTDLKLGTETASAARFTYDGLGGPVSRSLSNGVVTTYGYDVLGRLKTLTDTRSGNPIASWRWEQGIDSVPRLSGLRKNGGAEVASVYQADPAARIIAERSTISGLEGLALAPDASQPNSNATTEPFFSLGLTRKYQYDGRSNWAQRTALSPSTGLVTTTPTVDDKDAYTTFGSGVTATYDARGALKTTGSGTTLEQYTYDALGNMVSAQKGGTVRSYEYDAFGRRVIERDSAGATRFGYDGLTRAIRVTPDGQTDVTIDDGADEHILRVTGSGRQFYHQDRSHNVYLVTNSAGNPVEWYDYTAYGEMSVRAPDGSARTASTIGNRFGYQGQPFDLQLGLVDMRARAYKPAWGRFITPDPLGFGGGPNLYAFVGGAPLSFWDPLGLSATANVAKLAQKLRMDAANAAEQARVDAMFDADNSFTWGDAKDIIREMPADAWRGAKGFGQGALDGAKGTIHAIRHPGQAVDALGTFLGETTAKVYIGARDIINDGFDAGAARDRIEQWLVSTDPASVAYGAGHAAGVFDGGLASGMATTAIARGAINFVKETVILNRLVAGERAAAAVAEEGVAHAVRYGPHENGLLDAATAATFRGGSYTFKVLSAPLTLYRGYGGGAGQLGRYWFREAPSLGLQTQMDGALLPEWGNTLTDAVQIEVPAGTYIYEGCTAPQSGVVSNWLGGGNQVFIPKIDPGWVVPPPALPPPPTVLP
jgi:RHS repeat-associated protein